MQTLLLVVPDLGCHGPAKQVSLLAPALPRDHFTVHVAVQGPEGIFSGPLVKAGIPLHFLSAHSRAISVCFALQQLLGKLSPDIVQTWRTAFGAPQFRRFCDSKGLHGASSQPIRPTVETTTIFQIDGCYREPNVQCFSIHMSRKVEKVSIHLSFRRWLQKTRFHLIEEPSCRNLVYPRMLV